MDKDRVVWLLGSGFSKPLGGPLLRDLFHWKEDERAITPFFPEGEYPDLAKSLAWVQAVFHNGSLAGLWENAEEFLAYVDEGYGSPVNPRRQRLKGLILDTDTASPQQLTNWHGSSAMRPYVAYRESLIETFDLATRRALAAECSRFLLNQPTSDSERWQPYIRWIKSLTPGIDTIISFNYDRVVETAAQLSGTRICVSKPNVVDPPNAVPLLKVHGSVGLATHRVFPGELPLG